MKWHGHDHKWIWPRESGSSFIGTAKFQHCFGPRWWKLFSSLFPICRVSGKTDFKPSIVYQQEFLTTRLINRLQQIITSDLYVRDKQSASMPLPPERWSLALCPMAILPGILAAKTTFGDRGGEPLNEGNVDRQPRTGDKKGLFWWHLNPSCDCCLKIADELCIFKSKWTKELFVLKTCCVCLLCDENECLLIGRLTRHLGQVKFQN